MMTSPFVVVCSERLPGDGEADVDSIDDAFDDEDETFDRLEDEESFHSDGQSQLVAALCSTRVYSVEQLVQA